ncbi:MAG TPA: L-2-amino-thiazoline-4-carboxylic acid hydrolase [Oscillospiraceae bacterium]|nr:L-2-amino-thiazoline-4-carboxylic acid hydrolase [Oscillospiraceae bacterium]HNW03834.1 L-2-amino-thiazoline-4-carboxylic acid hydrolase [Oscillospiraceae bacterium]HPV99473.1 L-2-amino-thiazoline-4-carboxylic acid hydrolase [Oscillospiraceae bacterium]
MDEEIGAYERSGPAESALSELKKYLAGRSGAQDVSQLFGRYYAEGVEKLGAPESLSREQGFAAAAVAAYQALKDAGIREAEALHAALACFSTEKTEAAELWGRLDGLLFGAYKKIRRALEEEVQKNYEAAFSEEDGSLVRNVTACPYAQAFAALGRPELVRIACETVHSGYEAMQRHLRWTREYDFGDRADLCCSDSFEKV